MLGYEGFIALRSLRRFAWVHTELLIAELEEAKLVGARCHELGELTQDLGRFVGIHLLFILLTIFFE